MSEHLYKCPLCEGYTLEKNCPRCQQDTIPPKPPKFSLEDRYGNYRRETKKSQLAEKNLY